MSKENGFIQRRRGIWEHVRDGRLSFQDVAVHEYISSQADTRTGLWMGSAGALSGELCISSRMARRFIERLERRGYIRRFPTPGKHVCYPILIHKFRPTNGEHKGEQLDAINSISPTTLHYVAIEHGEHEGEQRGEHVSPQKRIENRDRIKDTPAAPLDIPIWVPLDAWHAYVEMRKEKKASITSRACLLIFKKLRLWMEEKGQDPREILEQSVMNGWSGIFELRKGQANGKGPLSADEAQRRTIANFGGAG